MTTYYSVTIMNANGAKWLGAYEQFSDALATARWYQKKKHFQWQIMRNVDGDYTRVAQSRNWKI